MYFGSDFSSFNTTAPATLVEFSTTSVEYIFLEHQGVGGYGLLSGRGESEGHSVAESQQTKSGADFGLVCGLHPPCVGVKASNFSVNSLESKHSESL